MPLGPGSTFHAWHLDRVLARGGSGTVYRATHRLANRSAAIKVITPRRGSVTDEATIARFHTEVELHLLRHANMPDFYDAELTADGTAVLVLELLDGSDLAGLLEHAKRLSVADALFVASEVLRTLQVLHRVGVHRDIKPSNLFVRRRARVDAEGRVEKRRVTLLDFGIAKVKQRAGVTKQNTVVGTPCYMSPEQLRGLAVDERTDLYAMGAVLYEMLCGHPPYAPDARKTPSMGELILAQGKEPPANLLEMVPGLPEEVWAFVRTLLAKEPSGRYPTAESAFAVAKALLAKHAGSAKRFREEIDGGTSEPLPPARPAIVDEPTELEDSGPPTEAMPARTVFAEVPPGAAVVYETERLDAEGDPLDPWEERQLASARRLLRAPRVFRSPAVANLDPANGDILGIRPLRDIESRIGSGPDAVVRVLAPDVLAHHATLRKKPDGRIELELHADATPDRGLAVDASTTAAGQIVHGTRFRCGPYQLQIVDRAIVDPDASVPPRRRTQRPILSHVTRATGRLGNIKVMNVPLALVGSLPACDLVVPGVASICAAVWLRGDGELELAEIDFSVLPLGQPVTAARLLRDGEEIELGEGEILRIEQPGG